jgi:putative nucleotide binding protein
LTAEDFALVLDFLAQGRAGIKREPLAQLIGTKYFTLLEAKPKTELKILEKVYIGKETREKIEIIKRRINFNELTANALTELENAIEKIISEEPQKFIDFFNNAKPISLRLHQIELLPGIGKKHLKDFLDEREKKPFESLEEIQKRVQLMPNPKKTLVKRIIQELKGEDKYYLFVRPPMQTKKPGFYGFKRKTKQSND